MNMGKRVCVNYMWGFSNCGNDMAVSLLEGKAMVVSHLKVQPYKNRSNLILNMNLPGN